MHMCVGMGSACTTMQTACAFMPIRLQRQPDTLLQASGPPGRDKQLGGKGGSAARSAAGGSRGGILRAKMRELLETRSAPAACGGLPSAPLDGRAGRSPPACGGSGSGAPHAPCPEHTHHAAIPSRLRLAAGWGLAHPGQPAGVAVLNPASGVAAGCAASQRGSDATARGRRRDQASLTTSWQAAVASPAPGWRGAVRTADKPAWSPERGARAAAERPTLQARASAPAVRQLALSRSPGACGGAEPPALASVPSLTYWRLGGTLASQMGGAVAHPGDGIAAPLPKRMRFAEDGGAATAAGGNIAASAPGPSTAGTSPKRVRFAEVSSAATELGGNIAASAPGPSTAGASPKRVRFAE
eukprot:356401-Chlamydomonas_euryale.AAC.1